MPSCPVPSPNTRQVTRLRLVERGSASLWGIVAITLLVVVTQLGVVLALLVARQHQTDAAADLAALSGAARIQRGEEPCPAAARVARLNGAELVACVVDGSDVHVTVGTTLELPLGLRPSFTGVARAGP